MRNLRLIKILSRIHPKSSVRKNLKFYLALQKNNNKIYIVESGQERELKPLENIKKLKLYFAGCNNIVKIHKGCQIKGLRVDIKGENNYLEIKPSQYELGALSWLVIEKGSKIILGKNLWVTSRLFMHAQGPNTEIVIGENCAFARETTSLRFPSDSFLLASPSPCALFSPSLFSSSSLRRGICPISLK